MAPRLLGYMVMCAFAAAACLPEYHAVTEDKTNHPVVITKSAILPPKPSATNGRVLWDPDTDLEFELRSIVDADADDTLYVLWLISYDKDVLGLSTVEWGAEELPANADGDPSRSASFVLTSEILTEVDVLRPQPQVDGGVTPANRQYFVQVFVSDRPLDLKHGVGVVTTPDSTSDQWDWPVDIISTGGN